MYLLVKSKALRYATPLLAVANSSRGRGEDHFILSGLVLSACSPHSSNEYFNILFFPTIETVYTFVVPSSAITIYSTDLPPEKSCAIPLTGETVALSETWNVGINAFKSSLVVASLTLKAIVPFSSSMTGCSVTNSLSITKSEIFASLLSLPVILSPSKATSTVWPKAATVTPIFILTFPSFTVPLTDVGSVPNNWPNSVVNFRSFWPLKDCTPSFSSTVQGTSISPTNWPANENFFKDNMTCDVWSPDWAIDITWETGSAALPSMDTTKLPLYLPLISVTWSSPFLPLSSSSLQDVNNVAVHNTTNR